MSPPLRGFLNEFRVWKSPGLHQLRESIPKDVFVFPIVKPMLQFVQIGVQMLHAYLVIRTDDRAFKQAPHAFDAVRVNITAYPFFRAVIDRLVPRVFIGDSVVSGKLVGVDRLRLWVGVVFDKLVKRFLVRILDDLKANLALALNRTDGDGLVSTVAASHSLHLAADIGFVHFHDALQKLTVGVPHRRADTVAQMPCRLIGDVQGAFHLEGGNPLLGFRHKVDRQKPLGERKVRVVEDRSGRNRKVVVAPVAVKLLSSRDFRDDATIAARATNTRGPTKCRKPLAALVIIPVLLDEFHEVNFGLHERLRFAGCAWMRHKL